MKKKVAFITCGIVVFAVIIAMVMFAFSGRNDNLSVESVNIEGIWKVVVNVNAGNVTIIDNEYMVFENNTASDYRDAAVEPFATSSFTIDSNLKMILPDISRKYSITKYTDNYIRLYESQNEYTDIIRYGDIGMAHIDTDSFDGTWSITYRMTDRVYARDYLVFESGTVSQHSGNSSEPIATSNYSWQGGNHLLVDAWSKEMVVYPISENIVIMVELETDAGYIWELQKAD